MTAIGAHQKNSKKGKTVRNQSLMKAVTENIFCTKKINKKSSHDGSHEQKEKKVYMMAIISLSSPPPLFPLLLMITIMETFFFSIMGTVWCS